MPCSAVICRHCSKVSFYCRTVNYLPLLYLNCTALNTAQFCTLHGSEHSTILHTAQFCTLHSSVHCTILHTARLCTLQCTVQYAQLCSRQCSTAVQCCSTVLQYSLPFTPTICDANSPFCVHTDTEASLHP